jgi:hypothetical protein
MARVYGRSPTDPALGDRLLGLLLVVLAVLLAWWWASTLGLDQLVTERVNEVLGLQTGASAPAQARVESPAAEATAPFCAAGQRPSFLLGFAELKRQVGDVMGSPVECEHANPDNGDALQKTTTGLAYYRKATNTAMFTDGWRHWAATAGGLVYWEGESAEPPR